ncbi:GGDEF domain-containing protein [Dactylosporangium sp. NPDC051485]|uniref:GGDEF domain-containing protein n=1 Tax=Dactylosporangium sp. NPDC051485 TaxID=3154846 RepID=UPI00344A7052
MHTEGRDWLRWRWPRVVAIAVFLLGGVAMANIWLHGESRQHEVTRARLSELNMMLHEESSLQWKTLADRNSPVAVARDLGTLRARERAILQSLEGTGDLGQQVDQYHAVLDEELGLLGVGKTAEAKALEQRETNPRFARLNLSLQHLAQQAVDAADRANGFANLAVVVAMVAAVAAIGVLVYRFEREHRASQRADEELLRQQRIALDTLAEHEALVRHQASHDPLTGLPNRRALNELFDAGAAPAALLLVDLDDFKPVNDNLGHAAGDELLIAVAERLLAAAGPDDTVVRLGGDEFAVVVATGDAADGVRVARAVVAALATPFEVAGSQVRIGASVGVAPADGRTGGGELLRRADQAMYRIKQGGKGGYEVFRRSTLAAA